MTTETAETDGSICPLCDTHWAPPREQLQKQNALFRSVLEHAQTNVRALTGGDERRIAAALAEPNLSVDFVPRAELGEAQKANAALRAALEALRDSGVDHEDAKAQARAALAAPNLSADFVPRAELEEQQRQYTENTTAREQQYQAELQAAKIGLRPELPPLPPNGSGLPRYGLHWPPIKGDGVLSVPMEDGYWTPWHLAQAELARFAEAESDLRLINESVSTSVSQLRCEAAMRSAVEIACRTAFNSTRATKDGLTMGPIDVEAIVREAMAKL